MYMMGMVVYTKRMFLSYDFFGNKLGSACEICLFKPFVFIPSSVNNELSQMGGVKVNAHKTCFMAFSSTLVSTSRW